MQRRHAVVAAALAAAALVPAAAVAAQPPPGSVTGFDASFTTARPGASSGFSLEVTGSAPAAGMTVPNFIRQSVTFPSGTRFDARGSIVCRATNEQLAAQGARPLCPAASRIGTGAAEGVLNGATVHFDLVAYAFPGRIHFAAERDGQPLKRGFFGTYSGRTLAIDVPTSNGAVAPTLFRASIRASKRRGHAYMLTPPRCPARGSWTVRTVFAEVDEVGGAPTRTFTRRSAQVRCRR